MKTGEQIYKEFGHRAPGFSGIWYYDSAFKMAVVELLLDIRDAVLEQAKRSE